MQDRHIPEGKESDTARPFEPVEVMPPEPPDSSRVEPPGAPVSPQPQIAAVTPRGSVTKGGDGGSGDKLASQGHRLVTIPEGEYGTFLINRAADIVNQKSARREAIYRTLIGAGLAAIVYLGYTDLRTIRGDVTEHVVLRVKATIDDTVDRAVDGKRDEIIQVALDRLGGETHARIALLQFSLLSVELEEAAGFSNAKRDTAIGLLRLVIKSDEAKNDPGFVVALERVYGAFFAADLVQYVDILDELVGDIAEQSPLIAQTLVSEYGMRVIGDAEISPQLLERFRRYGAAAYRHNFPETALPMQVGYSFREHDYQRNEVTGNYLQDVVGLTDGEKQSFLALFDHMASADTFEPSGKLQRIARTFQQINQIYVVELEEIRASVGAMESEDEDSN